MPASIDVDPHGNRHLRMREHLAGTAEIPGAFQVVARLGGDNYIFGTVHLPLVGHWVRASGGGDCCNGDVLQVKMESGFSPM